MRDPDVIYATLVVIVLALAQSLAGQAGTTYYVSTSGNDTNPGTSKAPWLTIHTATSKAVNGVQRWDVSIYIAARQEAKRALSYVHLAACGNLVLIRCSQF